jgi:hypothetical protein
MKYIWQLKHKMCGVITFRKRRHNCNRSSETKYFLRIFECKLTYWFLHQSRRTSAHACMCISLNRATNLFPMLLIWRVLYNTGKPFSQHTDLLIQTYILIACVRTGAILSVRVLQHSDQNWPLSGRRSFWAQQRNILGPFGFYGLSFLISTPAIIRIFHTINLIRIFMNFKLEYKIKKEIKIFTA